jgi:5-formyltetrahydrofolate cyclo-ligase
LSCRPSEIRKRTRAARQALSPQEIERKSSAICRRIIRSPEYRASSRIALYLSNDNEVKPEQLFPAAWKLNKAFYLPILKPKPLTGLWFGLYKAKRQLILNRFSIPEPPLSQKIITPAWTLDIAFVPLVAFDPQGNRLGMGGGFYDRTFSYLRRQQQLKKPRLIGLAFECQKVDQLPNQAWDVPLDGVITESDFYRFSQR